jgi:hypothetical protein
MKKKKKKKTQAQLPSFTLSSHRAYSLTIPTKSQMKSVAVPCAKTNFTYPQGSHHSRARPAHRQTRAQK